MGARVARPRRFCYRRCARPSTSASSASVLLRLFLRILAPAAAAGLTQSGPMTRPLPLPNREGGTKSSSLACANNRPVTSSSSSSFPSSVGRESCAPPSVLNQRTGELVYSSVLAAQLPPPPSTDGSIVPPPAYSPTPVTVLALEPLRTCPARQSTHPSLAGHWHSEK
jgi:hypothetical protein